MVAGCGSCGSRKGPMTGSCEHGYEISNFVKRGNFLAS
jgi:hypothetical protein